ncbi:WD repeat protein [Grosmannia clavigera kw1407]|uniref:WD repeat protein n=1 Tax=Grosmannia clavigera (strain kw1407 / UAMH 11150) TaxID=655863 RepID=F0XMN9_GROCL|nr:WD repeat protein [Grosmannia clavigera kw1407]EFX01105.1 WD repeat protein [Grosmannia clavigera kw1407]
MRKLLSKPTTSPHEASGVGLAADGAAPGGGPPPVLLAYRPAGRQDAVYQAGVPISALDRSPDGRLAVLGGRHILKTVRLEGLEVKEGIDLRALITAQQSASSRTGTTTASMSDQLSIRDVKWGRGANDTRIFTACLAGKIFQYDLGRLGTMGGGTATTTTTATAGGGRAGGNNSSSSSGNTNGGAVDFVLTQEDSRQINTLDINPHRGSLLLSGGQDGVVRCLDIRAAIASRTGPTFRSVQAFRCNADSVRRVQWSPRDGFYFACGTEQGVVLKWDIRRATGPILRINAHDRACTTISWHPDGEHLLSGGSDSKCHVWDVSRTADKRQKAQHSLMTAEPVAAVAWRPAQWSASSQGLRAAQVAVSYDVAAAPKRGGTGAVHVWDLARPTLPYRVVEHFGCSPMALLWTSPELLWTAGQDGLFSQCDVAFAARVLDRSAVSTLAFSARGDVLTFLDERPPMRSRLVTAAAAAVAAAAANTPSTPSTPSTSAATTNTTDSDDDGLRSFLTPRRRGRRLRKRRASSIQPLLSGSTPPSSGQQQQLHTPDSNSSHYSHGNSNNTNTNTASAQPPVLSLEQALRATGTYRPQQIMAVGHVPSAARQDVYGYLASHYLDALIDHGGIPGAAVTVDRTAAAAPLPERLAVILDCYARAAEEVSQFRLAQVWRILAFAMDLLLRRRAEYHREQRLFKGRSDSDDAVKTTVTTGKNGGLLTPTAVTMSSTRSLLTEEIESTSNMPTPLARPAQPTQPAGGLSSNSSSYPDGGFTLPAAAHHDYMASLPPRRHLSSMPISEASQGSDNTHVSSLEGYDFYDTEVLARAVDVPRSSASRPPASSRKDSTASNFTDVQEQPPPPQQQQRRPIVRQDSEQIFLISQISDDRPTPATSVPNPPTPMSIVGRPRESLRPSRLVHLNKALMALEWSGSDLASSPTRDWAGSAALEDDTYYPSATQDTASSGPKIDRTERTDKTDKTKRLDQTDQTNPNVITEDDYLAWPDDPPFPFALSSTTTAGGADVGVEAARAEPDVSPALNPYVIVRRALAFETRTSPLNASAMVLLLRPLVPADVIDPLQAAAILRQHHARLMGMQLFLQAALLRKLLGAAARPTPLLTDDGETAMYKAITSQAQHGVAVGYTCPQCHKSRDPTVAVSLWRCERCGAVMGPCAVCGHREASPLGGQGQPDEDEHERPMSTWWHCVGCGHGGHSTCLARWHGDGQTTTTESDDLSDGCCPLDGCGHACLPGRWRAETALWRSEELSSAVREVREARERETGESAVLSPLGGKSSTSASAPSLLQLGGAAERERERERARDRDRDQDQNQNPNPGRNWNRDQDVRADGHEVHQSRAVDVVRDSLTASRDGTRILGTSPGRYGGEPRERERRKSVKFARE